MFAFARGEGGGEIAQRARCRRAKNRGHLVLKATSGSAQFHITRVDLQDEW